MTDALSDELGPHEHRIPRAEAEELVPALFTDVGAGLDTFEDVVVHEGDLRAAQFSASHLRACMLVRGDLIIEGRLATCTGSLLLVTGNVTCRSAELRSGFACGGDFVSREFVYVNSGNDYGFSVGGTLTAKLFAEGGTASGAQRFDAEVWRCINVVVDGQRKYPKTPRDAMTLARMLELGLSNDAAAELVALI